MGAVMEQLQGGSKSVSWIAGHFAVPRQLSYVAACDCAEEFGPSVASLVARDLHAMMHVPRTELSRERLERRIEDGEAVQTFLELFPERTDPFFGISFACIDWDRHRGYFCGPFTATVDKYILRLSDAAGSRRRPPLEGMLVRMPRISMSAFPTGRIEWFPVTSSVHSVVVELDPPSFGGADVRWSLHRDGATRLLDRVD